MTERELVIQDMLTELYDGLSFMEVTEDERYEKLDASLVKTEGLSYAEIADDVSLREELNDGLHECISLLESFVGDGEDLEDGDDSEEYESEKERYDAKWEVSERYNKVFGK